MALKGLYQLRWRSSRATFFYSRYQFSRGRGVEYQKDASGQRVPNLEGFRGLSEGGLLPHQSKHAYSSTVKVVFGVLFCFGIAPFIFGYQSAHQLIDPQGYANEKRYRDKEKETQEEIRRRIQTNEKNPSKPKTPDSVSDDRDGRLESLNMRLQERVYKQKLEQEVAPMYSFFINKAILANPDNPAVMVLGAGLCYDLRLKEVSEMLSTGRLYLVDNDIENVRLALNEEFGEADWPENITIVESDIHIGLSFEESGVTSVPQTSAIINLSLPGPFSSKMDLVISAMVLSQLRLKAQHSMWLQEEICKDHVHLISALLKPGSTALLHDDAGATSWRRHEVDNMLKKAFNLQPDLVKHSAIEVLQIPSKDGGMIASWVTRMYKKKPSD